eukprot:gene10149-7106_t
MPPLLKGDLAVPSSSFYYTYPRIGGNSYGSWYPISGAPLDVAAASPYPSRHLEAALVRRELAVQNEYDHFRMEEVERDRRAEMEQQRREEAEERRRLIESARKIEEERARRMQEQQDNLLKKERELEEWKLQRAKEADALRQKRMEAEERRQEILFQRELERIKQESESRAASKGASEALEKSLRESQEAMLKRFQEEVKSREEEYESDARRRETEWAQRLEKLEIQRTTEMANLTLQLQQDAERAANFERKAVDAREEISRLTSEVESLKKLLSTRGPSQEDAAQSIVTQHKQAVAKMQESFEDDKRRSRRQYLEEVERLKSEYERRVEELRDHQRVQLRCKEEEVESLQRQLHDAQRCLEEERSKAAMVRNTGDSYFTQEEARLKEEVRTLRLKNQELEEQRIRVERRQRDNDTRIDKQGSTIQALQEELQQCLRKKAEELEELRGENHQLRTSLKLEKESMTEELESLRLQLKNAEERAYSKTTHELEGTIQTLTESREELRRQLEAQKEQQERKIRTLEEELHTARGRREELEREVLAIKDRHSQVERQLSTRLEEVRKESEEKARAAERLEAQLREMTMRFQRTESDLRAERDQHNTALSTASATKDREIQRLGTELNECKRELADLRESKMTLEMSQESETSRAQRQLREKEAELAARQREVEELLSQHAQSRASNDDLQRRIEALSLTHQRALRQKEDELAELQRRLAQAGVEKLRLERDLRTAEEQRVYASNGVSSQQMVLKDREETIARLEADIRDLRNALDAQRHTENDLRDRLSRATAQQMMSSPITMSGSPPSSTITVGPSSSGLPASAPISSPAPANAAAASPLPPQPPAKQPPSLTPAALAPALPSPSSMTLSPRGTLGTGVAQPMPAYPPSPSASVNAPRTLSPHHVAPLSAAPSPVGAAPAPPPPTTSSPPAPYMRPSTPQPTGVPVPPAPPSGPAPQPAVVAPRPTGVPVPSVSVPQPVRPAPVNLSVAPSAPSVSSPSFTPAVPVPQPQPSAVTPSPSAPPVPVLAKAPAPTYQPKTPSLGYTSPVPIPAPTGRPAYSTGSTDTSSLTIPVPSPGSPGVQVPKPAPAPAPASSVSVPVPAGYLSTSPTATIPGPAAVTPRVTSPAGVPPPSVALIPPTPVGVPQPAAAPGRSVLPVPSPNAEKKGSVCAWWALLNRMEAGRLQCHASEGGAKEIESTQKEIEATTDYTRLLVFFCAFLRLAEVHDYDPSSHGYRSGPENEGTIRTIPRCSFYPIQLMLSLCLCLFAFLSDQNTTKRPSYAFLEEPPVFFPLNSEVHGQTEEVVKIDWPWPTDRDVTPPAGQREEVTVPLETPYRTYMMDEDGRPFTQVLGMTVDPCHYQSLQKGSRHTMCSSRMTRRVAVTLSAGRRVAVPLLPVTGEASACGGAHPIYWEFAEPQLSLSEVLGQRASDPHPMCAEVLVGELEDIVTLTEELKSSWALTHPPREACSAFSSRPEMIKHFIYLKAHLSRPSPVTQRYQWLVGEERHAAERKRRGTVLTAFLATLPYRLLWLETGQLLLSLSCEERLLALDLKGGKNGWVGDKVMSKDCAVISSFSFPRGVVPLDMVELAGRGAVAVLRRLSTSGVDSAVFPVTKMALLMASTGAPPPPPQTCGSEWADFVASARRLQLLQEAGRNAGGGALELTSSTNVRSFRVRLGCTGGGDGVLEEPAQNFRLALMSEFLFTPSRTERDDTTGVMISHGRGVYKLSMQACDVGSTDGDSSAASPPPLLLPCVSRLSQVNEVLTCFNDGPPVYVLRSLRGHRNKRERPLHVAADPLHRLHLFLRVTQLRVEATVKLYPPMTLNDEKEEGKPTAETEPAPRIESYARPEDAVSGIAIFFSTPGTIYAAAAHHRGFISVVSYRWKTT